MPAKVSFILGTVRDGDGYNGQKVSRAMTFPLTVTGGERWPKNN